MKNIYKQIENHEMITSIYGKCPDFHDCEVISMHLYRDEGKELTPPVLRVVFYLYDSDLGWDDPLINYTQTEIEFYGVDEISIENFNHQNAIDEMKAVPFYSERLREERYRISWCGFGADVEFETNRIKVKSVKPTKPKKQKRGTYE